METNQLGSLTLAFMGDAIYEIKVREMVIKRNPALKVNELHKETIKYVKASAQAKAVLGLFEEGYIREDDWNIVKRGRNQVSSIPKNAKVSDYRYATGFEALIGHLYFNGELEKIEALILRGMSIIEEASKR